MNIPANHKETGQVNSPEEYSRISTDHNYCGPLSGKKNRNTLNEKECSQVLRNKMTKELKIPCLHIDYPTCICMVSVLTSIDIEHFKKELSDINSRIDQDKFLLTMITVKRPKGTKLSKRIRQERNVVSYFIPQEKGDPIRVCLNAFVSITSITRRRLKILISKFKNTNKNPKESREGFSPSKKVKSDELKDSVQNH